MSKCIMVCMQNGDKPALNVSFQNFTNAVKTITQIPKEAVNPGSKPKQKPKKK